MRALAVTLASPIALLPPNNNLRVGLHQMRELHFLPLEPVSMQAMTQDHIQHSEGEHTEGCEENTEDCEENTEDCEENTEDWEADTEDSEEHTEDWEADTEGSEEHTLKTVQEEYVENSQDSWVHMYNDHQNHLQQRRVEVPKHQWNHTLKARVVEVAFAIAK